MKGLFILVAVLLGSFAYAQEQTKEVDYSDFLYQSEIQKIEQVSKDVVQTVNKLKMYDFELIKQEVFDNLINAMLYYRIQQVNNGMTITEFDSNKVINTLGNSFLSVYILTDKDRENIDFYTEYLCTIVQNCEVFKEHFHSYLSRAVAARKSKKVLANIVDR
jgi:hypothetical protein